MDDDEEIITSTRFHTRPMLPVFSRTNKPKSSAEISQARSRDFQTVWCSNKGLTGLRNLVRYNMFVILCAPKISPDNFQIINEKLLTPFTVTFRATLAT